MVKKRERRRVQFNCTGPTRTRGSFQDECDVNAIMRRFERTGVIDHFNAHRGDYGDFTGAPADYHSALNQVIAAQDMFMSLPSGIRRQFRNDPGEFLELVAAAEGGDQAATDELVRIGVARARPVDQVVEDLADGGDVKVAAGAGEAGPKGA